MAERRPKLDPFGTCRTPDPTSISRGSAAAAGREAGGPVAEPPKQSEASAEKAMDVMRSGKLAPHLPRYNVKFKVFERFALR